MLWNTKHGSHHVHNLATPYAWQNLSVLLQTSDNFGVKQEDKGTRGVQHLSHILNIPLKQITVAVCYNVMKGSEYFVWM